MTVGLFGPSGPAKGAPSAWTVVVRAARVDGKLRARGRITDGSDGDGIPVAPGDRVRLSESRGTTFGINDLTNNRGIGMGAGGSGIDYPGPRVLIGARLRGSLPKVVAVPITKVKVHRKPLGTFAPTAQDQVRDGNVVARPSTLRDGTAFTVRLG